MLVCTRASPRLRSHRRASTHGIRRCTSSRRQLSRQARTLRRPQLRGGWEKRVSQGLGGQHSIEGLWLAERQRQREAQQRLTSPWYVVAGGRANSNSRDSSRHGKQNAGGWWPGVQRLVKKNRIPDKTTITEKGENPHLMM